MKDRVNKVVHQWNDLNDRWMYLELDDEGTIIGLNYSQGDEYEDFKENFCKSDLGLTAFYEQMLYTFPIEKASVSKIKFVNKCMWAYHTAITEKELHLRRTSINN